ncbi:triphosphoribosyl-dephospho-CoA synthase [Methylovorus sp. MM2]|uniref:triphosphoribosyl-dephospho-CoA synthase n=1 Tax=Methylovorus sp. MM2 TaxID=1848038 RepID=UPI0007E11E71|nr:triphosphoribosyl-dephospho-CoA synthase [Methylovorus sp. MM2]OAM52882.1 triphosphoribosyl-dephospho-CoA synthase [Methylovorus sp. MM2]
MTRVSISEAYKNACLAELSALKPGNVHIFADGHGMVVQDFVKSAEASSIAISIPELSVGARIKSAIDATWDAVSCNTNLGIVLLAAPLIQAYSSNTQSTLRITLQSVLSGLTVEDASLAYEAILRASPAGLGGSDQHDVRELPQVTLLEAMRAAKDRDLIAMQYANGYQDIFEFGVTHYQRALQQWGQPVWAVTAVYLAFLSHFPDSHIARKYGLDAAKQVMAEAAQQAKAFAGFENPKKYQRELLRFDADLKQRKLNPGTSADMTVATIFALELVAI